MLPRLVELGGNMLEARCCCHPQKLLGWLPVPAHVELREGTVVTFTLREEWLETDGGRFDWSQRGSAVLLEVPRITHHPAERVRLAIAQVVDGGNRWLAFKSEETPIEDLRRIPGFVEAS